MRITKVDIAKSDDGLEQISLERLSQVVLLAGKNGSGKSRILRKIASAM
jgi:predicted ATPase